MSRLAWLFAVENGEQPDEGLFPSGAAVMVEGSTTYEWVLAESDILANPEKWREFHGDRPTFVFTSPGSSSTPGRSTRSPSRLRLVSDEKVGQFARLVYAVT